MIKALENGYRGLFVKAQDLFDDMYASLADRSTRYLLNRLVRMDVLVIDEMGYVNLKPEQSNIFFKLLDERYRRRATLITTNLEFEEWFAFLGRKDMVSALLDRLRHHCLTIRIQGPSLRVPEDISANAPTPATHSSSTSRASPRRRSPVTSTQSPPTESDTPYDQLTNHPGDDGEPL